MSELTAALLTIEKIREITGCPVGVDVQVWVKQLAAENAGLKKALSSIANAEEFHGDTLVCDFQTLVTTAWLALKETPATDAVLAEVRAQGADECVRQLVTSDDDDFSDAPNVCAMVAHQLRKGVQS